MSIEDRVAAAIKRNFPQQPANDTQSSQAFPFKTLIIALAVLLVVIAVFSGGIRVDNSVTRTVTTIHQDTLTLRHWSDLSSQEKDQVRREGFVKFPQILDEKARHKWKAVNAWLVEEKGINHANARDIFRSIRGKDGKSDFRATYEHYFGQLLAQ